MIEQIVNYIAAKYDTAKVWEKVYTFVEQKANADGSVIIATYAGKGQYTPIGYDKFRGIIYTRRNGKIGVSKFERDSGSGCVELKEFTIPFRSVSIIKRQFVSDDCFADNTVAENIIEKLNEKLTGLKTDIQAKSVRMNITGIDDNRASILAEEYSGQDIKDLLYNYSIVAVDFEVNVVANTFCMIKECEQYG
jgi:hypothetical protein